mmetsp:Transcript_8443/g.12361  ORF Transcript_8443/g.12361 Transcript_8443/m.12361 type:complete len:237 (+) Transcript_8443:432-1142(+)
MFDKALHERWSVEWQLEPLGGASLSRETGSLCLLDGSSELRSAKLIALRAEFGVAIEGLLEHHGLKGHLCYQNTCLSVLQVGAHPIELCPRSLSRAYEFSGHIVGLFWVNWAIVNNDLAPTEESDWSSPTRDLLEPLGLGSGWPLWGLLGASEAEHDLVKGFRGKHGTAPRGLLASGLGEPRMILGDDVQLLVQSEGECISDLLVKIDSGGLNIRRLRPNGMTDKQQVTLHRLDAC